MIQFTDPKLYLKGTCLGIGADPKTGQILFYDNKFQTANFQTSLTMGEIRAGLGNAIATMLGSDSADEEGMLLFPGEGHELTRSGLPSHRVARFEAVLDWWQRHLKPAG